MACIVLGMGYFYVFVLGGKLDSEQAIKFASVNLEVLGLLILQYKIATRKSVNGVSGMSLLMYATVYLGRVGLFLPYRKKKWELQDLDLDSLYGAISFLLVMSILKSVFTTYRSSYQDDLDTLKATYLIPGCFLLATLIRPHFPSLGNTVNFFWAATLYVDVLALMPQVVMMANGVGKVEAPIAHFVAATAVSRSTDVVDSLLYYPLGANWSAWGVVFAQTVHLLLVLDFLYYYMKARASNKHQLTDVIDISCNILV